ncbi:hypothetical protein GCM10017786_30860 [Amycolatopsis deserti]|uniref:Uncharacterized protein n=1 Tax=Amycolatopsis deserti TaxID=185696 RepID=A0ABQ3IX44_9PSEU|nr:hypothetical protein [Amycolatopsis deserti]GHE96143.1 hypothetical protein GCM10017786_30860 [Amycolatopsis deserti]
MDSAPEVESLIGSLTSELVFARTGRLGAGGVAAEVYELALRAQRALEREADLSIPGPQSPADVAPALFAVDPATGLDLMLELAAEDLAFQTELCADREAARAAVEHMAVLLGGDALWWTNTTRGGSGRSWTPVTRHTFDGVVAVVATGGMFAALLQVAED